MSPIDFRSDRHADRPAAPGLWRRAGRAAACGLERAQLRDLSLAGGQSPQALLGELARAPLDWTRVEHFAERRALGAGSRLRRATCACCAKPCPRPGCSIRVRRRSRPPQRRRGARNWPRWQPLDAVLLGMGEDGHFASLFPGTPGLAAALDPAAVPGALCGLAADEPRQRLSANLSLLLRGEWLGLLVFGAAKPRLLEDALADAGTPASCR